METIDLVIIGAGPAGLSSALHLLQFDPSWRQRMVVLDKAAHPRHKLCGGGVTRFGLNYLHQLGFTLPLPIHQTPIHDARMVYDRRVVHVRGRPEFVVFHRMEFDAYLAAETRARGVTLLENTPAIDVTIETDGVLVTTPAARFQAQIVVGADGAKGTLRRLVNNHTSPIQVARLLEVVTEAPESAPQFQDRHAVFDFTPSQVELQGYVWDFPTRINGQSHFNRGIYDACLDRGRPRARLTELLFDALQSWGVDPTAIKPQGHPIHWFSPRSRFSRSRALLIGDAAGSDPLFGEGIAPALGYGQVAARTIQHAFATDDLTLRGYRVQLFASPVGRYLLFRWAIAWCGYRLSSRPVFMHFIWSIGKLLAWGNNTLHATLDTQ